jgi:hypothetical protein
MLNKFQVPIFITVFLVCLLTGFAITPRLWSGKPETTPIPLEPIDCNEEQCNFVIIHVDNLDNPTPALVSVWVALVSSGSPPIMVLKPLHPPLTQNAENDLLNNSFSLLPSGSPTPDFFTALDKLNFDRRGYIMMDNIAVIALTSWLADKPVPSDTLGTGRDAAAILNQQISLLNQVCTHLTTKPNPDITTTNPDWGSLVSTHLRTNLDFSTFVQNWERIARNKPIANCKILP